MKDASEIIKSGSEQPEIFHLTSLFEENVGPDRLSDMIATLIYEDIVKYTKRVYKRHELPIARSWDDIDRVVTENETIRREMSELVGKEWRKLASSQKKRYIKDYIFMKPHLVSKVIADYRSTDVKAYDIYQNIDYKIERLINNITKVKKELNLSEKNSYESTLEIIGTFKNWIENQKGYTILEGIDTRNEEKIIQRTLHGTAGYYCKINNLDISPESNTGRGPVDFKISRGDDKTVVEIKLTSNQETVHGFEIQIEEYAKSEGAENKIFLLIDNGRSSNRIKKVEESYENRKKAGENPAIVIVVDAKPKESASKYKPIEN